MGRWCGMWGTVGYRGVCSGSRNWYRTQGVCRSEDSGLGCAEDLQAAAALTPLHARRAPIYNAPVSPRSVSLL